MPLSTSCVANNLTSRKHSSPSPTLEPESDEPLIRAELFKLRTTNLCWVFGLAVLLTTTVNLVVNCVLAHSLLKPFEQYVMLQRHGHSSTDIPPEFAARLRDEWTLGHNPVTQAAAIFTSGQLIGVLLACLLGIVLVTSEYHQQTATTTFLLTPRRSTVVGAKLIAAVLMAALAWLVSTIICAVTGVVFLRIEGYSTQLHQWGVIRAVLLNLAAYAIWAVLGIGFGALIRSQLGATVSATVLYLVGATAAAGVFELVNLYVIKKDWILTAQVIVPPIASTVMISPTKTFDQSPSQWVGAVILVTYGVIASAVGTWIMGRRDIA